MRHLKKSIDHIRREKEVSAADMAQTIQTLALNVRLSCQLLDVPEPELLALLMSTIYMYQQTSTTSPLYLSLLILTYALFSLKLFKFDFINSNVITTSIAKYAFILALAITLYFCFYSTGDLFRLFVNCSG
uniref:Mobile element protein n=1 Tax=Streptococcus thermophilus TaxID=1308 RepID=A0A4Y5FQF0_STRTR|nr:mobile element protein [Streptococcus thermophilus]